MCSDNYQCTVHHHIPLCMYPVNVTLQPTLFFPLNWIHQMKALHFLFFYFFFTFEKSQISTSNYWDSELLANDWRLQQLQFLPCFSHRNNKWSYSARMGEWINQQRCCFVWNATINHRGLMSGRGKGHWCRELWGEDAPFVVIYYSEPTHQLDLWFTQSSFL